MAKVSTNISLDPGLKKSAQELFADLGMDLTTAITIFLKQSVREQAFPFVIRREVPNMETKNALAEYPEMKNNKSKYPRYDSFDDMLMAVAEDAADYNVK